jgi:hypothetical protein
VGGSQGSQETPATNPAASFAPPRSGIPIPPLPDRNNHRREASLSDYINNRQRVAVHQRSASEADQHSASVSNSSTNTNNASGCGESAIAVQSELQRAFINMAKSLYPKIQGILHGDTPRWLKQCAQDTYFSLGTYKQTQIPIDEELCYTAESLNPVNSGGGGGGLTEQQQQPPNFERGMGSSPVRFFGCSIRPKHPNGIHKASLL